METNWFKIPHTYGFLFVIFIFSSSLAQIQYDEEDFGVPEEASVPDLNCRLQIQNESANYLTSSLANYDINFVKFDFVFKGLNHSVGHKEGTVMPSKWVWTYHSTHEVFPYLKWPVDFPILSMGLLDSKTLQKMRMNVEVSPANCPLVFGEQSTVKALAYALNNLTSKRLTHFSPKFKYAYSYWCYLAEVPGVRQSFKYQLGIYIGYPVEFVRYNCCHSHVDHYTQKIRIFCLNRQIPTWFEATYIPFILSLILFAYFPIIFLNATAELVKTGRRIPRPRPSVSREYEDLPDNAGHDDLDWVYLDGEPPLSLGRVLGGFCGFAMKHPVIASRIRRTVFIFFTPIVIYVELLVYNRYQKNITLALIDHGVPVGFLSLLGGRERSAEVFVPALAGPFCLLIMYHILGTLFIILPKNLDWVVDFGTISNYSSESSPLLFDDASIETISLIKISGLYGYARARNLIRARWYILLHPCFWATLFKCQAKRFRKFVDLMSQYAIKPLAFLISFLVLPLFIVISLCEMIVCILFFGIPLIGFIVIASKGYARAANETLNFRKWKKGKQWTAIGLHSLKLISALIISAVFIYFIIIFCEIFSNSLTFLSKLIVFSFIAVVVYPAVSFGYLFFGAALCYYVYKIFIGIGESYTALLADVVAVSVNIATGPTQVYRAGNTFVMQNVADMENGDIKRIKINGKVIALSAEQLQSIRETWNEQEMQYVRYKNYTTGVPRALFDDVAAKYLPMHIQIVAAFLKLFLIICLVVITISITKSIHGTTTSEISDVMHVLFIIAVGALPKFLELALSKANTSILKDIFLKKLKTTIEEYWENRRLEESLN